MFSATMIVFAAALAATPLDTIVRGSDRDPLAGSGIAVAECPAALVEKPGWNHEARIGDVTMQWNVHVFQLGDTAVFGSGRQVIPGMLGEYRICIELLRPEYRVLDPRQASALLKLIGDSKANVLLKGTPDIGETRRAPYQEMTPIDPSEAAREGKLPSEQ